MHDELAIAYLEADKNADLGDMYANDGDYRRSALAYSTALGRLMAVVADVIAQQKTEGAAA